MKRLFVIKPDALPDLPGMMLATVRSLRELGGSASIEELDDHVIESEGVTEAEQSYAMPNDRRTRVRYFLAWSRTYLKRGGALENSARAIWTLTPSGAEITRIDQTKKIYEQVSKQERERTRLRRSEKEASEKKADSTEMPVEAEVETETSDIEPAWRDKLLSVLAELDGSAFERLTQRLLRESGFTKVDVRGRSGDGGIDGVGILRVNLVSFQVYFQCKRWQGSVPSKEIRDFRGAMQGRGDKGIFITTGQFTAHASEEAVRPGAIAIDLIDGERLCELLKETGLGVRTELVERVSIDPDWFRAV